MRSIRLFIVTCLLITGCEEKIDIPISSEETGLLVVEGVLTNENKNHLIRLSHPYAKQNGTPQPATGASVYVFEDTTISVLTEFPAGSGRYYTPVGRAVSGKMYTLYIVYNGMQYFARDTPPPVQPLEDLKYWETPEGYTLILDPSGEDPSYIEHIISWDNTAACTGFCEAKVVFYDLKTIDVNEIHKPERAPFHFPGQSLVVRKKYSVSPAYKTFLRSMLSETDWRGGVFDVQRSDVSTNLSTGAVGFFAVCSVVSDSTVVE
ncbi:MAG: DUF4249 family protein [Cyclobacteriaceae bacterium]